MGSGVLSNEAYPGPMLVSQAVVTIERPDRWAKQLGDHFAHKVAVEDTPEGRVIHFTVGDGVVSTTEWAVLLTAKGDSEEQVAQVQDVLGRHLERFAQREGIQVVWGEAAPID